jgi:hypothetical protein
MSVSQQRFENLQGLFEAGHPMIERQSERLILRLVPARAYSQDQTPMTHLVGCRRHLCENGGIAERIAEDQGAELDTLRRFGQRAQHGPALPYTSRRLTRIAVEEVVRHPDAVEAVRFRLLRDRAYRVIRPLAVAFAIVDQVYKQPNLHDVVSTFFVSENPVLSCATEHMFCTRWFASLPVKACHGAVTILVS